MGGPSHTYVALCQGQNELVSSEDPHCCRSPCLLCPYLTRRWALRESLPPADSTRQVYVPMSPDHVCEMCREPFLSRRIRGLVSTARVAPSFSHAYLWMGRTGESVKGSQRFSRVGHTLASSWARRETVRGPTRVGCLLGLGLWAGSRA